MPKRFVKRTNKKGGKRPAKRGRRLQMDRATPKRLFSSGGGSTTAKYPYRKPVKRTRAPEYRGQHGKAPADAASGGRSGFTVGRAKRMGLVNKKRKARGLDVLFNSQFPVIKDKALLSSTQIDWDAGTQSVTEYNVGYTAGEFDTMKEQIASAQFLNTSASLVSQPVNTMMDFYDKTTKYNFKNTSNHTVYLEIRAYVCKGYHSFGVLESWETALTQDNMLQNAATFGTEQVTTNIGNRPDFRMAHLNVRWSQRKDAIRKITLEPGQETHYKYVQHGGRFDQTKYNVLQGSAAQPVDVSYMPRHTAQLLVFCRAEMVNDAVDNDVNFGSGHLAVNCEVTKSWAAVPWIKPVQASFRNQWGSILQANEEDMNMDQPFVTTYTENR